MMRSVAVQFSRLIAISLAIWVQGCSAIPLEEPALERFEYCKILMGVEARLVLYAPDEPAARQAAAAAFDRIADLDATMSDYRRDSELMRLCRKAGGGPVEVSDDLFHILERSAWFSSQSNGAFDITVGPVVALWREARRQGSLPETNQLEAARRLVGYEMVTLDPDAQTVTLPTPGMKLDLGGIAKGYAADKARKVLTAHGWSRCLVDFSGDIVAGDPPPGRDGWQIEVQTGGANNAPFRLQPLSNVAVATSGGTEQFIEIDGVRYSHIVDPRTGLGLTDQTVVTVIAPDGTTADALASAISVAGPTRGLALADQFPEVHACIQRVSADASDQHPIEMTADFPRRR